ncbi:MAG TPA: hypothetical protein VLM42_06785 [Bryobacteraceae bacterium]|nr:hypothetical protein [Bryobacteraceae bacterium]
MTKLGLLGTALVLSSLLAGPAIAGHMTRHQAAEPACDPRDPGNPFSKTYDYMTWSAWRRRGGWDDRAEYTCQPIPAHPWGSSKW